MLERSLVKIGGEYVIDEERWFVWMIHKPGRGEGVTLVSEYHDKFYDRLRSGAISKKYMQMRKFQKKASLTS